MGKLFESLTKPFLKNSTDTSKEDISVNDPSKVTNDLGSDIDLAQLISTNMMHNGLKRVSLTNDQRIKEYRKFSLNAEPSVIIDEIVNEMYATSKDELPKITLHNFEVPKTLEKKINESFEKILNLLDFRRNGSDMIKQWYVDGHLFTECVYDNKKIKDGMKSILILDPLGMSKEYDEKTKQHFYTYSSNSLGYFGGSNDAEYKLDQIAYSNSGLKDEDGNLIGYLHPALKVNNQMTMIEDMLIVYRITRGSEKRAIKVNVGNMPKTKAINYMNELVNKFKYKKTYNTETGTVENNSHLMSVTEDIWLPTKNSTKDIEIDTLQGGMSLGELDDLFYFKNKLFTALKVPANRFSEDSEPLDITATEINRQEARFAKFIASLRMKFNKTFIELLRRELISTGSMTEKEFSEVKKHFKIIYPDESEIAMREKFASLDKKVELINNIQDYVGVYYSKEFVRKEILGFTEEEIEEMKEQMDKEAKEEPTEDEENSGSRW